METNSTHRSPSSSYIGLIRSPQWSVSASFLIGAVLCTSLAVGQSGSQDVTFGIGTGANNRVFAMAAQPDGKHILGGSFTSYNGTALNRLTRINRNGTRDATFTIGTGPNSQVTAIAVAADGKILIGGAFSAYNGALSNRLARLNVNGGLDNTFNMGSGFAGGTVNSIAIQADGRIVVVGTFTSFNGTSCGRVARLITDGSLDPSFTIGAGANGDIYSVAIDANGKALLAGSFTSVGGTARPGLARLNTNGTLDTTFNPGVGPNGAVYCVTHQRDGKVLVGGLFTSFNGSTPAARIARLNRDGTYDNSFSIGTGFNSWVYTIVLQGDGKLLVGGDFTTFNGNSRGRLVRLNTNGSLDTGFSTGTTLNNWVYAITWQPEGRVTVGGGFTNFNGTTRNRLVKLHTGCDETLQLVLRTDGSGSQTSWELIGEGFTYAICSGSGYPNNTETTVSCCVPYGGLRLRVLDSAGDGMSTGGYVLKDHLGTRLIDNTNDGVFASESSIADKGSFYVPASSARPIFNACDKLDWLASNFIVASAIPEVTAQWGVGDQTDDGYEFWFYDPDGAYSQRKFRNHATSGGSGSGATRACHQRLSWTPSVNPIPEGVLLNVKIRGRVNGVNYEWGPAYRFKIDPVAAACPLTKLLDDPADQYFSCGSTRTRSQFVTAKPVAGANRYEFQFVNVADGYSHTIQSNNYHRSLSWATPALVVGHTYQVRVRASRDGGSNWCPWGETCSLAIASSLAPGNGSSSLMLDNEPTEFTLWPNPTTGGQVQVSMTGSDANATDAQIMVFDAMGKLMFQKRYAMQGAQWNTVVEFSDALPSGQYVMRVENGEVLQHQRFVVSH